ncbi:thymidylate synthase [Streptomyces sp. NPDC046197]|uniref:thymidylate synthase n=1 Tax=Streptomyces sp. NPDC046197 TaxID=3154337 RepID=UPI0033FAF5A0
MSRNINEALLDVLTTIDRDGSAVPSRGGEQKEILGALVTIDRPSERVLTVPQRNNNVFAQIAETLWVLAGRNDLEFLGRYLPRAADFSDDGSTWRAAYGPRLRAWGLQRVDQLAAIRARLSEDPLTKRAVATIFDPAADHVDSLDVPCNNWLHFLQRDGELHLSVAVRANDAIWGFSGINVFEWSVLHEIMARTFGWTVGRMSWYVGTLHVYERHYATAQKLVRHHGMHSMYEYGISPLPIECGLDTLDAVLDAVLEVETAARSGATVHARRLADLITDPFFNAAATMLRAYHAFKDPESPDEALRIAAELPPSDLRLAALEYLGRRAKTRNLPLLPAEREYLEYYWSLSDRLATTAA